MSYIKKELLIADILDAKIKNVREDSRDVLNIFERMVKRQPDVDVVEVVRCKDCEHLKIMPSGYKYCRILDAHTDDCNYCRHGKKKSN